MIDFKAFTYVFEGLDLSRLDEDEENTTPEHDADGNITYLTPKEKVYEDVSENQFVKNVMALYNKSNISLIELTDYRNLGVNTNGNIVVLDLGIGHL